MQNALKQEIKRLSKKILNKERRKLKKEEEYSNKFLKRTGLITSPPKRSGGGSKIKHFDPVYCARNANFLAKTIWFKVREFKYEPNSAINYQIPKPDNTKRSIMAFSIPDAALANVILRRARDRNIKRLSPSSYAYHPQKNVFDAILALQEYEHDGKLFAVQVDFEKYFDNIPSWYLDKKLNDEKNISLTPHEKYVFKRFMHHRYGDSSTYPSGLKRRHKGTPQGASVSLFLANLANHELDLKLSAAVGRFVRFADDVVALCSAYEDAQKLEQCFAQHCRISGLVLNTKKSPGIAIISSAQHEIRTCPYFDYLGYRFSENHLSLPDRTVQRIKIKISRLVNIYLIYYLKYGFNLSRTGVSPEGYDWDLLGLIYELRRSLYGGLSEDDLDKFIKNGSRLPKMRGLMGFYCLLTDSKALKELDGWLLSTIRRAMRKRREILYSAYSVHCITPTNKALAKGTWLSRAAWGGPDFPETRVPSFMRGWRAARKHFFTYGLEQVQAPGYNKYSSIDDIFDYF